MTFFETEGFLKEHQAFLQYDERVLADDVGDLG